MAFASYIHLIGGSFQAELSSNDRHQLVGLDKLAQNGIPARSNARRHTLITDFAEWEEIAPGEYARHFGIDIPNCAHQVFQFRDKRRRFIVPALALMRALFRPNRDMLAAIFLPQGLGRITTPHIDGERLCVHPNGWRSDTYELPETLLQPLAWMHAFPSANRMCGSVHENARQGRIGLELPVGRVRLVLRSEDKGNVSFVTGVTIISIDTDEAPWSHWASQPRHITFHDGERLTDRSRFHGSLYDHSIPLAKDGRVILSDTEWTAIEPLLRTLRGAGKHSPRALLDGIITKLALGQPWKSVSYQCGTWTNASALHRRLVQRGVWAGIVGVLRESRVTG